MSNTEYYVYLEWFHYRTSINNPHCDDYTLISCHMVQKFCVIASEVLLWWHGEKIERMQPSVNYENRNHCAYILTFPYVGARGHKSTTYFHVMLVTNDLKIACMIGKKYNVSYES